MALGHFKHVVSRCQTRMHDRSSNGEFGARLPSVAATISGLGARRDRAGTLVSMPRPRRRTLPETRWPWALRARYDQVRVPNPGVSESEIAVVSDYVDA